MRIAEATLTAQELGEQRKFYGDVLGLPVSREDGHLVAFGAGESRLAFVQAEDGAEHTYHFAFDVPRNRFREAKDWLAGRTELLKRDGRDEFEFASWNAAAAYFRDPAGNIVEFIARRGLPNDAEGPFGSGQVLRVSEVGLVVGDVSAAVRGLRRDLGIGAWSEPSEEFTAVGDETGLLIVVREGRPWFPTEEAAGPHPVAVVARCGREATQTIPDLGYRIDCVKG